VEENGFLRSCRRRAAVPGQHESVDGTHPAAGHVRLDAVMDHMLLGTGRPTSIIKLPKVARLSITCYVMRHDWQV
jgi:hypothetical protein